MKGSRRIRKSKGKRKEEMENKTTGVTKARGVDRDEKFRRGCREQG